jgi:hypothetical protein
MRARNFWTGALFAALTFISLTAFLGRRHHGWHRGWDAEICYHHEDGSRSGAHQSDSERQHENDE